MPNRRVTSLLVLGLLGGLQSLACAPAPAAPPPHVDDAPTTATIPPAVTEPAPAPTPEPQTTASVAPTTPAPPATEAPPPCIDGEIMMGACICARGKGVDATGHCVFTPCPKGTMGGAVFRDETGQCMECRPGTRPSSDGKCSH